MRIARFVAVTAAVLAGTALGVWFARPRAALGHCDTMDGPVVMEARAALEAGDVTPVLKWVAKQHEGEIRALFDKAVAVRAEGAQAKELADTYFFETLVRLHRASEGAPYTGLKPTGQLEPPVAAADSAIAKGSVDELARKIGRAAEQGVRERFERVIETQKHKDESVEAGREYVEAYVAFVHYVEGLHAFMAGQGGPHAENED
jgi:hypothetical protein